MSKYTTLAGMDVHARSVTIRAAETETGETWGTTLTGNPSAAEVAGWLLALPQPVYCAYESGCTGFHLARELRALGVDCDVIAVSTLPRSQRDRRRKCDRLDAAAILREMCNPKRDYTTVWVPDEATEAGRNLVRACEQASRALRRARQELHRSFLRTATCGTRGRSRAGAGRPGPAPGGRGPTCSPSPSAPTGSPSSTTPGPRGEPRRRWPR